MKKKLTKTISLALVILLLVISSLIPYTHNPWWYFARRSVAQNLDSFTDPVLLPGGTYRAASTFTTHKGWKNAYSIRYNAHEKGQPAESVYMLQFSEQSEMRQISGGPEQSQIDDVRSLSSSEKCTEVDKELQIKYCPSKSNSLLVRTFNIDNKPIYAAIFIGNTDSEETRNEYIFSDQNLEARIAKSLEVIDLPQARQKYYKFDG